MSDVACTRNAHRSHKFVSDCFPSIELQQMWQTGYISSHHEKHVELHLKQRSVEYYPPSYHALREWRNGFRVILNLPPFPGYIFVRINRAERMKVLEVPGVLAVLGNTAGEMTPSPKSEVNTLRSGLYLRQAEPHSFLAIDQRVRIRSGTLAEMDGMVVRNNNSFHAFLTMDLIIHSVSVEVDGSRPEQLGTGVSTHV